MKYQQTLFILLLVLPGKLSSQAGHGVVSPGCIKDTVVFARAYSLDASDLAMRLDQMYQKGWIQNCGGTYYPPPSKGSRRFLRKFNDVLPNKLSRRDLKAIIHAELCTVGGNEEHLTISEWHYKNAATAQIAYGQLQQLKPDAPIEDVFGAASFLFFIHKNLIYCLYLSDSSPDYPQVARIVTQLQQTQ